MLPKEERFLILLRFIKTNCNVLEINYRLRRRGKKQACHRYLTSRPPLIERKIGVLIFRKSSLGHLKLNKYMGLIQNFPLRRLIKIAVV
jgi:hypothetical protein